MLCSGGDKHGPRAASSLLNGRPPMHYNIGVSEAGGLPAGLLQLVDTTVQEAVLHFVRLRICHWRLPRRQGRWWM